MCRGLGFRVYSSSGGRVVHAGQADAEDGRKVQPWLHSVGFREKADDFGVCSRLGSS